MRAWVTRGLEQLGNDLGIGLAVEPYLSEGCGASDLLAQRSDNGSASRPGGQQNGAVDVEEDQLSHLSSNLRTATSRSQRFAALLPGSQGSTRTPPQARVEWTRVSASPAKATWVIALPDSLLKKRRSPGRIASGETGVPRPTC
jgi:hypothetical protein